MEKDKMYNGVSAVIVFALVILQYALANGILYKDRSTAWLFMVTLVIVVYKTAEVLYKAIKNPVPPPPKKEVLQTKVNIPIPQSPVLIATDIKVPVPPRPKAMYYFTAGIFIVSVFILYYLSILRTEPVVVENLIRGLFITALIAHLFGTAALFSKTSFDVTFSQEAIEKSAV